MDGVSGEWLLRSECVLRCPNNRGQRWRETVLAIPLDCKVRRVEVENTYRREDVGDDVDGGADEGGAEEDEESQLRVEEIVSPRALIRKRGISFSANH